MLPATNTRTLEHDLLELLIVPDVPRPGCEHIGLRSNTVNMGGVIPGLYGVRQVTVRISFVTVPGY